MENKKCIVTGDRQTGSLHIGLYLGSLKKRGEMQNEVYKLLKQLNIEYIKIQHPPLFTCEDSKKYNLKFDAMVCKTLFLRNSNKSQYYIVILPIEKKIDLKQLQILLGETRLSFSDEENLKEKLGVKSGAVSIFNVINIKENDIVFILDKEILEHKSVGFSPNINTETVIFNSVEINKILEYYFVQYKFIDI